MHVCWNGHDRVKFSGVTSILGVTIKRIQAQVETFIELVVGAVEVFPWRLGKVAERASDQLWCLWALKLSCRRVEGFLVRCV